MGLADLQTLGDLQRTRRATPKHAIPTRLDQKTAEADDAVGQRSADPHLSTRV